MLKETHCLHYVEKTVAHKSTPQIYLLSDLKKSKKILKDVSHIIEDSNVNCAFDNDAN